MTNNTNNDDYVEPVLPADEHGARGSTTPAGADNDHNIDYTTTGDPIDSPEHVAEENLMHATPGVPLTGEDDVEGDVDYTTPGNPITSPQHEAEERIPHATPGNNPLIPEDEDPVIPGQTRLED